MLSTTKNRVTFDFETRGRCGDFDLKKVGAFKYSLDSFTRPTCMSFKIKGSDKVTLLPFETIYKKWENLDLKFRMIWTDMIGQGFLFCAHNAFFERCIYENILMRRLGWPSIPLRLYRCTAAKAAACALPRNLEGAGAALKLKVQKDKFGYVPMRQTMQPTRAWKTWKDLQTKLAAGVRLSEKNRLKAREPEPKMFIDPEDAPDVFEKLYYYCKQDTRAEEALDDALPDLLPEEQEIWFLNQTLNWRGLRIDIPTVKKISTIMAEESKKKLKELDTLTLGLVTKPMARKSVFEFLALEGVKLPNLQAKTVDEKLESSDLSTGMRRLLEIRKALSKTSTKKYQSFLDRAHTDDRVRDILMYHGGHTGRDTGTGIQPHNFPRGIIRVDKNRPYAAVENVIECEAEMLRLLYGDSLAILFSSILRNMIIPSEGCELFVADFSKIEVAVLWWLACNLPGLKALRAGKDPYIYQAVANTGRPYESFNDESPERQLGKAQVLGCGFGMGWEKFKKSALDMHRLKLSDEQSKAAVENYRQTNAAVPRLWKNYENAAIAAAVDGISTTTDYCKFFTKDDFLWVELPSGRRLAYREPQVTWRESEYGPRRSLEFFGVDPKTRQWGVIRSWGGKLTENIVQGVARDLMMPAMLRLEKAGYRALLMVHDEGIAERKKGLGTVEEFVKILCTVPKWATGCPIDAKGWFGPRYRK